MLLAVIRVLESVYVALVTAGSPAANHVRHQITETNARNNATAWTALFVITWPGNVNVRKDTQVKGQFALPFNHLPMIPKIHDNAIYYGNTN